MFSKRFVFGLAAVGAAMLAVNSAKALTIADLTSSSGSLTVGEFTFSNFTYGGTTPASSVLVTPTGAGLEFSTSPGGWTTPDGSSVISYDISSTPDAIKTVNLSFEATATGN